MIRTCSKPKIEITAIDLWLVWARNFWCWPTADQSGSNPRWLIFNDVRGDRLRVFPAGSRTNAILKSEGSHSKVIKWSLLWESLSFSNLSEVRQNMRHPLLPLHFRFQVLDDGFLQIITGIDELTVRLQCFQTGHAT